MTTAITLTHPQAGPDLINYLNRARRINDGAARLIAEDSLLQVYVGVFFPRGLLDSTPTVLGLRVLEMSQPAQFDLVVPLEALVSRVERSATEEGGAIRLPSPSPSLQWAAITPPREGWRKRLGVPGEALRQVAAEGVAQVKNALPDGAGEAIVQKVRSEVWGQDVPGKKGIPWGAGFAADALGFAGDRSLGVHTLDNWVRLTSKHGYVLVKTGRPLDELGEPGSDG